MSLVGVAKNDGMPSNASKSDPTAFLSIRREVYRQRIEMVMKAAQEADVLISDYILEAVIHDRPFSYFEAGGIPCGKDYFYDRLRRFFYILDELRM